MRHRENKAWRLKVYPSRAERNWPWIPVCDKGMLPPKVCRHDMVIRMRVPPPMAVTWIRARIRHWRVNWQR